MQIQSSAAMMAEHSSFAQAEKTRGCCEELKDAEERIGIAQLTTSKACNDAEKRKQKRPSLKLTLSPKKVIGVMRLMG